MILSPLMCVCIYIVVYMYLPYVIVVKRWWGSSSPVFFFCSFQFFFAENFLSYAEGKKRGKKNIR